MLAQHATDGNLRHISSVFEMLLVVYYLGKIYCKLSIFFFVEIERSGSHLNRQTLESIACILIPSCRENSGYPNSRTGEDNNLHKDSHASETALLNG